jgi:hypothetical protein
MGERLGAKIAKLPPEAQRRIHERTAELVSQERTIQDLCKAASKAEVQMARLKLPCTAFGWLRRSDLEKGNGSVWELPDGRLYLHHGEKIPVLQKTYSGLDAKTPNERPEEKA